MTDHNLIKEAAVARERAWAPYSRFRVGAALLAADGSVHTGCNVEDASYGLTMCAERVALYNAVSRGHRAFTALAVVADAPCPVSPCGACRQAYMGFAPDLRVVMANLAGQVTRATLAELLPSAFLLPDGH
ncbi:MAG: cytidine deaminase [Bacillota bacterium]